MRARGILATAAALTFAASIAPSASAAGGATATERGTTTESRITTIRGACNGAGHLSLSVRQLPDSGQTDVAASGLPDGHLWSEHDFTSNADHTGGGGRSESGWSPVAGRYSSSSSYEALADPLARANVHSDDKSVVCNASLRPNLQWGRSTCALAGRTISVTATKNHKNLDLLARFKTVRANSAWNVDASIVTRDASEGAGATVHASDAGVAQFKTSFAYASNRTIKVAFTDRNGRGCRTTLLTHLLPPPV